jgi:hypothetical protein
MQDLPDRDRDALVLRYFERKTLAQVADALAISGDAAEKRVARGLDKLRGVLARHGVVATAVPLATLLSTEAVHAAPAALVHSIQTAGPASTLVGNAAGIAPSIAKSSMLASPKALTGLAACLLVVGTIATLIVNRATPTKPVVAAAAATGVPTPLSLPNGMTLQLVHIPAGGAIAKPFLMGKFEVTQAQWAAVMPSNPSRFRGDERPVERVTWTEAKAFCEKLSVLTSLAVRLPTEQEWEHASRAGTTTLYYFGDDSATLSKHAWHGAQVPGADPATKPVQLGAFTNGGSGGSTHRVGTKLPNPWGLHDIYGNVWEWCDSIAMSERVAAEATSSSTPTGSMKVRRGGSWHNSMPIEFRSNYRWVSVEGLRQDNVGLRVVVETQ